MKNHKRKCKAIIIIGLMMMIGSVSVFAQTLGDVNNSGSIDIVDALLTAQYYVGLNPSGFVSGAADVNCSGAIDIVDALVIAQYYVGLITGFSCSTPAPTPVPTIVPTAGPSIVPGAITVYYLCNSTTAVSNSIQAQFKVQNNGTSAINLSNVKIRYWYTLFTGQDQSSQVYWADAGTSNVTVTFAMMSARTGTADCIMELIFGSGAGTLAAGATSQLSVEWNKTDWSNYNQANDYSFDPSFTAYGENNKVTGYISGSLAFGTEPSNPPATATPTVPPTAAPTAIPTIAPTAIPTANTNLAWNRNAYASSVYANANSASTAFDGNMLTRWESAYSDPQWLYVDLGRTTTVNRVRIIWEAAYGSQYTLQISSDAQAWTAIYTQAAGAGGTEDITITNTTKGRYVRMYGTQRATEWGYSIWEFEVFGTQEGPAASFAMDKTTPVVNQVITFDASGSSTPSGTITAYNWAFGDGASGTGKTITHAYSATGTYHPTLTITTDGGLTASTPIVVTVYTPEPKASFATSPKVPNAGQAATFDASGSWDPNGTITSYSWSFGDGGTGTGKTVTHTYSKDGFNTVTLTLTDSNGLTSSLASNLVVDSTFAPPLHVAGNQIIDANGSPVILQGFAVYDPIYWQEKDVIHWKNDWKVKAVRLVMITDRLWYNTPADKQAAYLAATDNVLAWCRENKIYVILDGFHEGGNTGDVAFHYSTCQAAWKVLAPRYKNQDHIIWEIYNEPYNIDWTTWVPNAEALVDIIRSYNPVVTACIVPGTNWAQDAFLDLAQVNRTEIIYSWHPYPHVYSNQWDSATWDVHYGYITKYGIAPVLADEWGWSPSEGNLTGYGQPILKYFISRGVNWAYWGFFPGWGAGLNLVNNNYGDPEARSEGGDLVYNYLNGL